MDDVAKLIRKTAQTVDKYGNQVFTEEKMEVFVQALSTTRSEFYNAAQAGLRPDLLLRISHAADYAGETEAEYHGKRYAIIRAYRIPNGDAIELTLEEKAGTLPQPEEDES